MPSLIILIIFNYIKGTNNSDHVYVYIYKYAFMVHKNLYTTLIHIYETLYFFPYFA